MKLENHLKICFIMMFLVLILQPVLYVYSTELSQVKEHHPPSNFTDPTGTYDGYKPGDTIKFHLHLNVTVGGAGPNANDIISIRALNITDNLPVGLTYVALSEDTSLPVPYVFFQIGNTLVWKFGQAVLDEVQSDTWQASVSFNATVDMDAIDNKFLTNQVTSEYYETVSGSYSSPSTTDTVWIARPILNISKECSSPIHEGDSYDYIVTLTNTGHLNDSASITDFLPPGILYTPGTAYASSGIITDNMTHVQWSGVIGNITGSNKIIITIPVIDNPNEFTSPHLNMVNYTAFSYSANIITNSSVCLTNVIHPVIFLNKTASPNLIHSGGLVTYTYNATNTGDTTLYNVTIYDLTYMVAIAGPLTLAPGQSHVETYNINVLINTTNIANVAGFDILGLEVNDTDSALVKVINPSISLHKSVTPDLIYSGDLVIYTYNVTNTGDATLFNVTVFDITYMAQVDGPLTLKPDESHISTYMTNIYTDTLNVANATGFDALGKEIFDVDSAFVEVITAGLSLNKTVSPSLIHSGDLVTYKYNATNTGSSNLYNVTIYDLTHMVAIAGPVTLVPHESLVGVYMTNIYVNITNIANATGVDELGNTLTDLDSALVEVINPAILLEKNFSLSSATEPSNITYYYKVTNIGDTRLSNVYVYDETLDILLIGPIDLNVGAFAETSHMLMNMPVGTYMNTANATGMDVLGLTVASYDTVTCTITAIEVGGETWSIINDDFRHIVELLMTLLISLGLIRWRNS